MNLSDTFYIALCMTVLILGVVYWFWTQNQFIQRKVNQLENIVYELNAGLNRVGGGPGSSGASPYSPPPSGEDEEDEEDDLHGDLRAELEAVAADSVAYSAANSVDATFPKINEAVRPFVESDDAGSIEADVLDAPAEIAETQVEANTIIDDLQPGGVGSGVPEPSSEAKGGILDTMTLKELKRLAEQRGVAGTSSMRKPALIEALRAAPSTGLFEVGGAATLTLS